MERLRDSNGCRGWADISVSSEDRQALFEQFGCKQFIPLLSVNMRPSSTFIIAFILAYCLLAVEGGGCHGHGAHNHDHDHDHPVPVDVPQWSMPMLLLWAIGATLSVSLVSLAGMLLVMKLGGSMEWLEMPLVGFGAGSMLSAALLLFLPESVAHIPALQVGYVVMIGGLAAMFLELLIHAFTGHSHSHGTPSHKLTPTEFDTEPAGHDNNHGSPSHKPMSTELDIEVAAANIVITPGCQSSKESLAWNCLIGDALHNLVDGVLIGTTFGASGIARGCIVTAAIIAHELPKEVAELFILFSLAGW